MGFLRRAVGAGCRRLGNLKIVREITGHLAVYVRQCEHEYEEKWIRGKYDIHPSVRWGARTRIYGVGQISIGEGTYLGDDCYVSSHPEQCKIKIGRGCALAHSIHIRTTNYPRVPHFKEALAMPSEWGNIVIGDYCWIGVHVYIGPGITIGDNCIIGANSVVTKDVPPNTVVGGVPARHIHDKAAYTKSENSQIPG